MNWKKFAITNKEMLNLYDKIYINYKSRNNLALHAVTYGIQAHKDQGRTCGVKDYSNLIFDSVNEELYI